MPSTVASGRRFAGARLLLAGLITVGFYLWVESPMMKGSMLHRYTTGHPVEHVSVGLFVLAALDLLSKASRLAKEKKALAYEWLPPSSGPQPVTSAVELYGSVNAGPNALKSTYYATRLREALHDVREKRSADELEEHLRYLADQDADRAHSGYSLVRVIAWMIPILGFLGTVIGITLAIANISPSQLESSLHDVTGGLAVAFDTTALALALSIGLMLMLTVVEGAEQRLLQDVEKSAHRELAYRFLAGDSNTAPYLAHLQATGDSVIEYTRKLVEQQSMIWANTVAALQHQAHESNKALEERLHTIVSQWQTHFRDQGEALTQTAGAMVTLQDKLENVSRLLLQVVQGERQLVDTQERLAQNLSLLQQTQAFDEALNSMTAAIHLLTIRHQPPSITQKNAA
jgi:biopolymer transport protein ExbB/TolQ